jgi:hypothetical protein
MPSASAAGAGTGGAPTPVFRAALGAGRLLGRLDLLTARIRPWMVLGPLVVLTWGVMAFVFQASVHNGWLHYDSGDGTWYYTTAWQLAHARIPISAIGYGYPLALAPLARIAGPNMLAGMPYVVVFNALVLAPVALLCVYGLAKLLAGQRFAYLVSAIWVVAPLLAIRYFLVDYHRRYVGETLPADLGLTTLGDFPSMVCLLIAGYFTLRTLLSGRDLDALAGGLAIGLAIAVKPSNATFLPAPFVGLLLARRPRALAVLGAGLIPSLVCLAIWKDRGLGYLPLFQKQAEALAAGPGAPLAGLGIHVSHYLPFNWHRLYQNIDGFREFTWSRRLIEWSLVAGLVGLGRRSVAGAGLIGVWLASFVLLKGASVADFYGGSFFRYMAPAFPAAFLLAMSVPLLIPILGRKLAHNGDSSVWPRTERARRGVVVAGLVLGIAPIVPLLAFPPQSAATSTTFPFVSQFVPANQFTVTAVTHGGDVTLSWPSQSAAGSRVEYSIFRSQTALLSCTSVSGAAVSCQFPPPDTAPSHSLFATHWTDRPPGAGRWIYRVVVGTGAEPPIGASEAVLLSRAVTVVLPK